MALTVQVNRDDSRPLYLQIASQIKNQISLGRLPPGTRLPSVRQMAERLEVNRLTVHNAYSELQADGWVESTVGRGTYVLEHAEPLTMLSSVGRDVSPMSVLSDFQPIKQIPTVRSLATTEPDPALAPVDEFWGMLAALRRDAPALMSYELTQGDARLRVEIANLLRERGIEVMPDQILVSAGAMQALSLVTEALAREGDTVLIEQPTYLGIIHLLKMRGVNAIPVPVDEDGPDLDALDALIRTHNPRFFYTIPNFQNPTGYLMSEPRRCELIRIAHRHDLPIVEDDIMAMLAYDTPSLPALRAWNNEVIHIGSFSKMLMPGLRIGYVVAPPKLHHYLVSLRMANDLFGSSFVQRALANFMHMGRLKAHLRRTLPLYKARRDTMLSALNRHMPAGVTWTQPVGGFSLWLTLPHNNMPAIYRRALQHGLAFTPGTAFLTASDETRHMRLCFSTQPVEEIESLVALLADLIRAQGERQEDEHTPLWTPMS